MQSLEPYPLTDPKKAKKRLRKRARLQRVRNPKNKGFMTAFMVLFLGLAGYGLYALNILPETGQARLYAAQSKDFAQKVFNDLSFKAGFQIQDISIKGLKNLDEEKVLSVLGFGAGVSSLNYDSRSAWKRLKKLKWVKSAKVRLLLPGTVYIQIEEYEPYARIQEFGQHFIINERAELLKYYDGKGHHNLPLFVGHGAVEHAVSLNQILGRHKKLFEKFHAAIRVDNRRWDLLSHTGKRILLPEHDLQQAILKLLKLDRDYKILDQKYRIVDLRLPDRLRLKV